MTASPLETAILMRVVFGLIIMNLGLLLG